jgi:hypothetical protein
MKYLASAAIAAAALLIGASTASAAIYEITLTGDTESINDFDNVFGLGGETVGSAANITNQPFVETFYLNTAGGNAASSSTFVSFDNIFGTSPPYALGATLEINGQTFSTLGGNYSYLAIEGADYYGESNDVVATDPNENNDISFDIHSNTGAPLPTTVTQTFSAALNSTDYEVLDSFSDSNAGGEYFTAAGNLYPTEITISEVSAAPEPASWLLMIAGVGGVGLVLRRTKKLAPMGLQSPTTA